MIIIGFILTIYYYIAMGVLFLVFTPLSFLIWVITTPLDKTRSINHIINCFVGKGILALNPFWNTKAVGLEKIDKNETYVVVSNHQSLSDIVMLTYLFPLQYKYVAKKALVFIPFLGWIMAMAHYILLSRNDPKSQFRMMRNCEHLLKEGVSIAIFPEGTRSRQDGELLRFKDGASVLAKKTSSKILPVCMIGNNFSMPTNGFIWTKRVKMTMVILDPISPDDFEKPKELTDFFKQKIKEQLNRKAEYL